MRDWYSGLIDFSSIPFKKNCALLTKLDWCSRGLHLHSTFGSPQSYFSEFVMSPFYVSLPLFTNRYFALFASFFCVCTSILLSYSILCEQITADWPLVIKYMWRSTFKCRYCSVGPTPLDRLNSGSHFYVQHKYFMPFYSETNQMHNISNLFYFGTTFYMFRTVSPSIIRSLRLYIQHQVCVIQVLWNIASTIAASSSIGWQYLKLYVQLCALDDVRRNRLKHVERL
jgi:hypothetical protein